MSKWLNKMKKVQKIDIVCTLGPACSKASVLEKMAKEGMTIARLNFSHGTHEDHADFIFKIRKLKTRSPRPVLILQDLEGYRIRVGELIKPVEIHSKQRLYFSNQNNLDSSDTIPIDFDDDLKRLKKNLWVFIDDGKLALRILGHKRQAVEMEVVIGGTLKARKGINIPGLRLKQNILTDKDRDDIAFGIRHKVDYMAQSFVRNAQDMQRVIDLVRPKLPRCQFIAKIENEEGLKNLGPILKVSDGIMVARGDLGVSIPIYEIPIVQKEIICHCNAQRKYVITATQMLESMTESIRPTRAEVTDVANAILDGTGGVMLSGETAVGRYPLECVKMMRQIIEFTIKKPRLTSLPVCRLFS